ncbi:hypothetical protein H2199_000632 [Coniosporium tulheliwenetii]|uniref:Uncharacterized protein n=1 Tax=Coniosporium tulheliwenetii TaxID=3383036 RepID=A0ACC2ZMF7_9PEZI|nr:hypothetical protein H2199_000632 [Cladosporium sp. JES 115]
MPQFNFDTVWNTLSETDKRRIVAIWCCEQPTKVCTIIYQLILLPADEVAFKVDWDFVAKATSSAHGGAARKANGKLLTKLKDGGAVEDGNETTWDTVSEKDKRRIVAMWALSQPVVDWKELADFMGSGAKGHTMYCADLALRKKLTTAGAERDEVR